MLPDSNQNEDFTITFSLKGLFLVAPILRYDPIYILCHDRKMRDEKKNEEKLNLGAFINK